MCGRYTADTRALNVLVARRNLTVESPPFSLGLNLTPGRRLPIVTQEDPTHLAAGLWGYVPAWAAERGGKEVINVRAETIREKPYFRTAIKRRRCLIPASGFYEWKGKVPHYFRLTDREVFCLAGLYEPRVLDTGEEVPGFAIITTNANDLVASIHHRMPVILDEDAESLWIDDAAPVDVVVKLLAPSPSDAMQVGEARL
jgi:putative SOS response-associated peptidase YedK